MSADANVLCARCGQPFHCGVNDASPCWCVNLELNGATLAAISERYVGCLCGSCLAQTGDGEPASDASTDRLR